MKHKLLLLTLLLGSCAAPPPGVDRQGPPSELLGRAAGAPQRCVDVRQAEGLHISDTNHSFLIYGSGRTIWANNLGQCRFGAGDILVTHPFGSSYCRGDIVRSFDRMSHIPGPACVLSDFVPYTR